MSAAPPGTPGLLGHMALHRTDRFGLVGPPFSAHLGQRIMPTTRRHGGVT
jgi:hypothetical protein